MTATGQARTLVPVADGVIEVVAYGPERDAAPAMLTIPSLGRGAEDFARVALLLAARGWRVLCPEPRGFGRSSPLAGGMTLRDLGNDIAAVAEAAGRGPAVVAGHAFGSWIARMCASLRPDLAVAVALLAAAPKGPIRPELRQAIDRCMDPDGPRERRLDDLARVYFAPSSDPSTWLEGWCRKVARAQREAAAHVDQAEWWGAGGRPLLDLQAAHDAFLPVVPWPALGEELGARVAIEVVPGAGHALLPERPDVVAAALDAFGRHVLADGGAGLT